MKKVSNHKTFLYLFILFALFPSTADAQRLAVKFRYKQQQNETITTALTFFIPGSSN